MSEREVEVAIEGLAVFAHHGALPEEQALGERGDGSGDGSRGIRGVRRVLGEVGFPVAGDVGIDDARMDDLIAISLDDYCLTTNPVAWGAADVEDAFRRALAVSTR